MKGKTTDEARAELEAQGFQGEQLEELVPPRPSPATGRPTRSCTRN
jgi:hypothetical protein